MRILALGFVNLVYAPAWLVANGKSRNLPSELKTFWQDSARMERERKTSNQFL